MYCKNLSVQKNLRKIQSNFDFNCCLLHKIFIFPIDHSFMYFINVMLLTYFTWRRRAISHKLELQFSFQTAAERSKRSHSRVLSEKYPDCLPVHGKQMRFVTIDSELYVGLMPIGGTRGPIKQITKTVSKDDNSKGILLLELMMRSLQIEKKSYQVPMIQREIYRNHHKN